MEKVKIRVTPPTEKEMLENEKRLLIFSTERSKSSNTLNMIDDLRYDSLSFINTQLSLNYSK